METLTVPTFERPIRILEQDPSRPPSAHSLHRSMSEESLHKITFPLSREVPYTINPNLMPPSPARTPTGNRSEETLPGSQTTPTIPISERIIPLNDMNVSFTNLDEISPVDRADSPVATRDNVDEYIQQTADVLADTLKELKALELSHDSGVEHIIAANLRLLRTLKDRHSALDKVDSEIRQNRSAAAGPYTSLSRSIYFDTPGFTPPQTGSRIAFKDLSRRGSAEADRVSTMTVEWDQEKETRLKELEKKLKSANLAWSEDQNQYLEELEQLKEEKRKHKKFQKKQKAQTIKMERSQSMSSERDVRSRSSNRRASSADTKRRLSLGFVPRPLARTSSSGSFIKGIFRVGK